MHSSWLEKVLPEDRQLHGGFKPYLFLPPKKKLKKKIKKKL
jgi:hypothetical protein